MRSDFADEWDVLVLNEGAQDGPNWVILDAVATRTSSSEVQITHFGTGRPIAKLTAIPDEDLISCP